MKKVFAILFVLGLSSPAYALDGSIIDKNKGDDAARQSEQPTDVQKNSLKKTDNAAKKVKKHNKHKNIYQNKISRRPHRENTQH